MGWLLPSVAIFLLLVAAVSSTARSGPAATVSRPRSTSKKDDDRKRVYDIMNIFENLNFKRDIFITVRIYDSQCYAASTESTYIVYLASLSFDGLFLEWFPISSVHGVRRSEDGNPYTLFELIVPETDFIFDPEICLSQGSDPCVPRADVIYIQYHNEKEDSWSIANIEVDVEFRLWPGHENWHSFRYSHPVLAPCDLWLAKKGLYQIGPRIGLFAKVNEVPLTGQWVRDWI